MLLFYKFSAILKANPRSFFENSAFLLIVVQR